ncbi:N-acetylmuramoyl-L-alanine amidase [Xylocopilactobacillus apicola]|uniref:N-acetylmuramoyl-L-alanine amidase n=1 Tax=Xylocopilactobacillus apicola TaxID=2932184 RepID=UPI0029559344|nr:N-acetylmuramoyl-L-alanine amidase [Xylocopilactobacillus apicola]
MSTYTVAMSNVVTIKAKVVNVRTGPMLSYNVMAQLKEGDQIQILEQKNGWDKIRLDGDKIGWVADWLLDSSEIDSATNATGVVNTSGVNIREYANTQSKVLNRLEKGTKVNIVYTKGDWSQITMDGKIGWINNKLFDLTNDEQEKAQTKVYVLRPTINLYQEANPNSHVLATSKQDDQLEVVGSVGDFYQVKNGKNIIGYVSRQLVTTEIPNTGAEQAQEAARPRSLAKATIVIDAGHGGDDPGAQANDNRHYEKNFSLLYAKELRDQLQTKGTKVVMIRNKDSWVSLEDRVKITNKNQPSAFISLHLDSSKSANEASGITTYYYSEKKDLKLAKTLASQFNGLKIPNRNTNFGNFEVIRENDYPGVLLEIGYINSDSDFAQIRSDSYRQQFISRVVLGLESYFK